MPIFWNLFNRKDFVQLSSPEEQLLFLLVLLVGFPAGAIADIIDCRSFVIGNEVPIVKHFIIIH
ncbi:hypothetical protein [Myxosarcina sp. GI1]|uniref:hypothetical protein n=1 Tax=Myxosarcina sp. GI1 TaxID=1541065 RepID=UPI0012E098D3|nr:hypothetical protein [Myxosarcina sp. GI1]